MECINFQQQQSNFRNFEATNFDANFITKHNFSAEIYQVRFIFYSFLFPRKILIFIATF